MSQALTNKIAALAEAFYSREGAVRKTTLETSGEDAELRDQVEDLRQFTNRTRDYWNSTYLQGLKTTLETSGEDARGRVRALEGRVRDYVVGPALRAAGAEVNTSFDDFQHEYAVKLHSKRVEKM